MIAYSLPRHRSKRAIFSLIWFTQFSHQSRTFPFLPESRLAYSPCRLFLFDCSFTGSVFFTFLLFYRTFFTRFFFHRICLGLIITTRLSGLLVAIWLKYIPYFLFSFLIVKLIYPLFYKRVPVQFSKIHVW